MIGFRRKAPIRQQSVVFEVTQRCNHDCPHCYNAWKNPVGYPMGELPTAGTLALLDKLLDQTGASLVSLSGGEPMLRGDIYEIVDHIGGRGAGVNLITNGSLLDEQAIGRLAGKVKVFELPLLSARREVHDEMSGLAGAFDRVTRAVAELKALRQVVVCVFVATRRNIDGWRQAAELAVALGADGIMFNRFNPGGRGRDHVSELQATPQELAAALDVAEEMAERYGVSVSCSIAMPPCLVDSTRYKRIGFGYCSAGTSKAYFTMDPLGNVRPCNHSPTILGNIANMSFAAMVRGDAMRKFRDARPALCGGCRMELTCQGGCKAAAEACYGDVNAADPFLSAFAQQAKANRPG